MIQMKVEGIEEVMKRVEAVRPQIKAAMAGIGLHLKGKIAVYPRASEANEPGEYPARWYERGYGSKWALKGGGVNGKKTSETLGRRWTSQVKDQGMTVEVGNNVSYGPLVQGADQQPWHKERGWLTDAQVVAENEDEVLQKIRDAIQAGLDKG